MKISYNWLSELVNITLAPLELAERLTMTGLAVDSVDRERDDHILDIDVLSNRPDALSHIGVAREVAVICGTELKPRAFALTESAESADSAAAIEIEAVDLCPRYAARVVAGVKVGPSPAWLVSRLESIGQRSVNNIADISNYVMFEIGQPTHAFDLKTLQGRKIIVRRAAEGETITTLDGFERELSPEMLVIADANHAVAIAGIMGGEETEISDATTDVLIESAYFTPGPIRRTVQNLGLDTEASYRFARGVDYELQAAAADRVAALIQEIAGGTVLNGVIDAYPKPMSRQSISMRQSRVERISGLKVELGQSIDILNKLGFDAKPGPGADQLTATVPSYRIDIFREIDLVEEVVRHAGYDLVDTTLPTWSGAGNYRPGESRRREIWRVLTGYGFNEAISFSFVNGDYDRALGDEKPRVILSNPMDVDEEYMRSGLLTGLVEAVRRNFNQGERNVRLFEIGRTFESVSEGERPVERESLALILTGAASDTWKERRAADFYELKGIVESLMDALNITGFTIQRGSVEYLHPGQSAVLVRDGLNLAQMGRLHPRVASLFKFRQPVYVAEFDFQQLLHTDAAINRYKPLPRYPSITRDVSALLPEDIGWSEIERAIRSLSISEIVDLSVFDVYKGSGVPAGLKSVAFRVVYRRDDRTLTDDEAETLHSKVREIVETQFGAQFR